MTAESRYLKISPRIRDLMQKQDNKCACGQELTTSSYFDCGTHVACFLCRGE